ncbi:MAG: hypothetical protein NPIRA02_24990 [Nitrospirales bacterium]|nr:MAG: hypothetical protein NPIRA02_24990 [Nitrospirales bacterium]
MAMKSSSRFLYTEAGTGFNTIGGKIKPICLFLVKHGGIQFPFEWVALNFIDSLCI